MEPIRRPLSAGVICEFNPFHIGHAHLLAQAREAVGADGCVVCLMSGLTVQRGEPAMADPYLRARTALAGGADLVLELPFPWSSGSAVYFATAGVDVLSRLGVQVLAFGSECGDAGALAVAAELIERPDFQTAYTTFCREGMGSTAAYMKALRQVSEANDAPGGDHAFGPTMEKAFPDGCPSANDLLGINYLSAIRVLGSSLRPLVIRREGSGYRDDRIIDGAYPSATALRAVIREAACDPEALAAILEGTMPPESLRLLIEAIRREECPVDDQRLPTLCHAMLRLSDVSQWDGIAEMNGGVAGHMIHAARSSATPSAFMEAIRTKQYTDARLRRAMLFALTGVTVDDLRARPAYTILLAASRRGCDFLRDYRRATKDAADALPVITKPADAPDGRQRRLAERADALFTLTLPSPKPAGEMLRRTPWVEKDGVTTSLL